MSAAMSPSLTRSERIKQQTRRLVEYSLRAVPWTVAHAARDRALLLSIFRYKSIEGRGSFTVAGPRPISLVATDSSITRLLYWYGADGYEQNEVFWWRRLCERSASVLEIGANIGYYTIQGALAAPDIPYTSVEAHPVSVELLRRNLALNSVSSVSVVAAAVVGTATQDFVELALPDLEKMTAPTGAFLSVGTEGVGRAARPELDPVPAIAASELVGDADLVKLDIEGSEYDVLSEISEVLIERRASVLIEVIRDTPRLRTLLLEFARQRYGFYLVSGTELEAVPSDVIESADLAAVYGSRDVAVIADERVASFRS